MFAFSGILNDKLRGFYRSTFTDDDGNEQVIATTQFEATDARRAFPCWDEPDFKAVFGVTLVVPTDLLAVSNGAEIEPLDRATTGACVVRFADTMAMSTYLVAFVVGPLEATEPGRRRRRPAARRAPARQGPPHRRSRSRSAPSALRYFADYYGIPYPGDKLDLVAVPDFAVRRDGEPRLHHLPRDARCWSTRRRPPSPSCRTSPTSSPTSSPTCGSATS